MGPVFHTLCDQCGSPGCGLKHQMQSRAGSQDAEAVLQRPQLCQKLVVSCAVQDSLRMR